MREPVEGVIGTRAWSRSGAVRHWLEEAEAGRYEVDRVEGYLAGMAGYVLVGELAVGEVLAGALPRPGFPDALRQVAPARWRRGAASSLAVADWRRSATTSSRAPGCSPRPDRGGPGGARRARRAGA
jgi:hypothetical protein